MSNGRAFDQDTTGPQCHSMAAPPAPPIFTHAPVISLPGYSQQQAASLTALRAQLPL